MKIETTVSGQVLRKIERANKNNTKKYYSIMILQSEEVPTFNISKEIYDVITEMQDVVLDVVYSEGYYNGHAYSNWKVVGLVPFVKDKLK